MINKRFNLLFFALVSVLAVMATDRLSNLPCPILGGELSNSAATSVEDINEVMPRMRALGLNTVLVPAYWELMEPVEGQFDFTLIDRTIDMARQEHLHVVFLWFGVWKNSMSCYTPGWFKQDTKRFPRAMTAEGKQMEIASCFSDNVLQADLKAFSALMRHIREKDPQREVVIMMQIENEIGMLESARDHSPLAEKAYLKEKWAERYGTDEYADEKFMALSYARYVEHLAKAAREIHDMPLYVNAAMNSRGRRPGEYPSAGPLAHLIDFWHEGAPSIDLLAPDIYDTGFKSWCAQYAMPLRPQDGERSTSGRLLPTGRKNVKNRLFIPESRCCENSGINDDNVVMTCRHYFTLPWDPRATDGTTWPEGGAMLIRLGKYDYLLAGSGVVIDFKTPTEKQQEQQKTLGEDGFAEAGGNTSQKANKRFSGKRLGLLSVDEVSIADDGTMQYLRRHNGDQTHQGRHARIGVGEWKVLHIKLYEY